jgi:hypothetical protein
MSAAAQRSEWIKVVKSNLNDDTRNGRSDFVREYFRRPVDADDGMTDKGFAFALNLYDNYRKGLHLCLPDVNGWLVNPEHFLGEDWQLGTFEDTMVLATMAIKDPSPVMSLAALARLAPRATTQELVEEIVAGIGDRAAHADVRESIGHLKSGRHRADVVEDVQRSVAAKIHEIRATGFEGLKGILRHVMEGRLGPREFVDQFFELSEKCTIRPEIYAQMLINLMNSAKIRPLVKLILLENVDRMPTKVRYQVYATVNALPDMHENFYLKRELAFLLEKEHEPEVPAPPRPAARGSVMSLFD